MLTQIVRSQSLWMQVAWVLKLKAEDFVIRTLKPLGWYVGLREVNQKENQFWPYFRCMLRFKISLELPWMWDVFLTQVPVFYWLCVCVCVFYEIQYFQCLVILRKEASHIPIHTYDHGGSCQSLGILASEVNYFYMILCAHCLLLSLFVLLLSSLHTYSWTAWPFLSSRQQALIIPGNHQWVAGTSSQFLLLWLAEV